MTASAERFANDGGSLRLGWPEQLRPFLEGATRVALEDPADGTTIASAEVVFDGSGERVAVVDRRGRWLALNKWDHLGRTLEGSASGMQERMVDNAAQIAGFLEQCGLDAYLIGGSLLGMVRDGALLPHDDDLDLTVMSSGSTVVDVVLDHLRLDRRLREEGYEVVRHSAGHLQVTFLTPDGGVDHYVDVFVTFLFRGHYAQPFPFWGTSLGRDDVLPAGRIDVLGRDLPAPADPAAWLRFAYGEGWSTPDPGFSFGTPRSVTRRHDHWFGLYDIGRIAWEEWFEASPIGDAEPLDDAAATLLRAVDVPVRSLDLGTGDGAHLAALLDASVDAVAVDYSIEALALVRERSLPRLRVERLNVNDQHDVATFTARMLRSRSRWFVHMRDLLHTVIAPNRPNVYGMLRWLGPRATAYARFDTDFPAFFDQDDPQTWHLEEQEFLREIAAHGLSAELLGRGRRITPRGDRDWVAFAIRIDDQVQERP